ncbi:hypothetical protein [Paenibacillus sp. ISL-20]|uniref:hypothetical protein n=1 Tax=Paenibacillus sp. ISL-20 TaxID=2819163 RepID=UPI001BE5AA7D|nr:hypothetical protein [Paenibacillus sp. ISL-20]MBT2760459.1 hypothetical protein [Paenibacillus sp. ISL-20]
MSEQIKNDNLNVKKRMMFSAEDDYYYFAYNTIIFLQTLGFTSEKKRLQEWSKLNYLIPFLSNHALFSILASNKELDSTASPIDRNHLKETYLKSRLRLNWAMSLFYALQQKGIISISKNETRKSFDVWLCIENLPAEFSSSELFRMERDHSEQIKSMFSYIRTMKTDSLLDELFRKRGVHIWED